jgi:hypothetical protein
MTISSQRSGCKTRDKNTGRVETKLKMDYTNRAILTVGDKEHKGHKTSDGVKSVPLNIILIINYIKFEPSDFVLFKT